MHKKAKRKLHNDKGFTLAETLLAVLIMLMVSVIMATGIPSAKEAYEKTVLVSNAEVLMSTTINTLRNELGTAQDVVVEGETSIKYFSPARGTESQISIDATNGIMFQRYYYDPAEFSMDEDVVPEAEQLVSPVRSTADLVVSYTNVAYNDGIVTFSGLKVSGGASSFASRDVSIRVVSE